MRVSSVVALVLAVACDGQPKGATPMATPALLNEVEFLVAFNDAMCAEAQVCGADTMVLGIVCAGVLEECATYDASGSDDCLTADWPCGPGGVPLPSTACDQACVPPQDTGSPTPTPPPPTPVPFSWTVELIDGDGAPDTPGGFDADQFVFTIQGTEDNHPEVVRWEFGLAQTSIPAIGWFGEDCDGVVTQGTDVCHTLATASGTRTLNRTNDFNAVADGFTLFPVDFPVANTPPSTYVIHGYRSSGLLDVCFSMGDAPSYYPSCNVYTP